MPCQTIAMSESCVCHASVLQGHACAKQKPCLNHVFVMQVSYLGHARVKQLPCLNHAYVMQVSCPRSCLWQTKAMPESFLCHASVLPRSCLCQTKAMSESCVCYARVLSRSCLCVQQKTCLSHAYVMRESMNARVLPRSWLSCKRHVWVMPMSCKSLFMQESYLGYDCVKHACVMQESYLGHACGKQKPCLCHSCVMQMSYLGHACVK